MLQAWRDALADLPADMSERPRERRRARRTPTKRRQDICPLETPHDALLDAWRDALAQKVEGVCKNRLGKTTAQLAQETMRQQSARVTLADQMRHADRVAAKANLYARGARIRREATGGRLPSASSASSSGSRQFRARSGAFGAGAQANYVALRLRRSYAAWVPAPLPLPPPARPAGIRTPLLSRARDSHAPLFLLKSGFS